MCIYGRERWVCIKIQERERFWICICVYSVKKREREARQSEWGGVSVRRSDKVSKHIFEKQRERDLIIMTDSK